MLPFFVHFFHNFVLVALKMLQQWWRNVGEKIKVYALYKNFFYFLKNIKKKFFLAE